MRPKGLPAGSRMTDAGRSLPPVRGRTARTWRFLLPAAALLVSMASSPCAAQDDGSLNFNLDQVSIRTFASLVGRYTGRQFVVAEEVDGKVTVVSPPVKRADVFPLFVSILESVGCSVVEDGGAFRVVKTGPRKTPSAPVVGVDTPLPATGGLVTKVFRLAHVSASDVSRIIESKVSGGAASVGAVEETGHLVVTDTVNSLRQIEAVLAEMDRPGLARMTEVISLKIAGADELATQLNAAMAEGETRGEQLRKRLPNAGGTPRTEAPRSASVIAAPHSNQLILIGTPQQLDEMRRIVAEMDVEAPPGRGRLNAVFLKYLSAEDTAKSLSALLAPAPVGKEDTGPKRGAIAIQASPANNALLVDCSASDFDLVQRLIDTLDVMPRQVQISVMIAEVSAGDQLDLGVEMAAIDSPGSVGDSVLQGGSMFNSDATKSVMNSVQSGLFPRGISVGVAHGSYKDSSGKIVSGYPFLINIDAIKQDTRVEIKSETSLAAQDNRETSVKIVEDIPILKSKIEGGSGSARDVIQNIERADVGIKLTLKPHIVPSGEVQMELHPIIEAILANTSESVYTPTIARREVSTTVTVPDGRTIVIAGLTREDVQKQHQKVPLLGDIPLLGWLFRKTADKVEKKNMLIFVTPRVVANIDVAQGVMEEWRQKTNLIPK